MSSTLEVAIGILVEQRDNCPWVLIARRRPDAVLANFWELPGGKIEAGETPAQCLAREYDEELNVRVVVGQALPVIEFAYDHAHVRLHPFFCARATLTDNEPCNLHVAEHRWVRAEELCDYQFPPANTTLIRRVRDTLVAGEGAPSRQGGADRNHLAP